MYANRGNGKQQNTKTKNDKTCFHKLKHVFMHIVQIYKIIIFNFCKQNKYEFCVSEILHKTCLELHRGKSNSELL